MTRIRKALAAVARHRLELLDTAGLALLSTAGGMLAPVAGVAVAGVSCFVLAWRLNDTEGGPS